MTTKGKDRLDFFVRCVNRARPRLQVNSDLLTIYKGQLLPFVQDAIKRTIKSPQSQELAMQRIPPINVLQRIIAKTSKLYSQPPKRMIKEGTGDKAEQEVLAWYQEQLSVNAKMGQGNDMFCLYENALIEPYLSKGNRPSLRVIPSDRFVPYCYDERYDDEFPDGFIVVVGRGERLIAKTAGTDKEAPVSIPCTIYKATDAEDFTYFDDEGNDVTAKYSPKNPEGKHDLKRIPYVYINREANSIQPVIDTDTLPMTVLIPSILTDINFAHMFQSFGIMYAINLDDDGLMYSPGVLWLLKSPPGEQKVEVGTVKPECDTQASLELVAAQLAFWLNTKGIKPGAVGEISAQNFQSGISKIVDEMDTSEVRTAQVPFFKEAEERQLWELIFTMHQFWRELPGFGMTTPVKEGAKVVVDFAQQLPLSRRADVLKEVVEAMQAGLMDRQEAVKRLEPTWSADEIEQYLERVDSNRETIEIPGGDVETDPNADPNADPKQTGPTLLGVALNGAQISSLIETVKAVAAGEIPRTSGVQILAKGLAISEAEADKLMADAGGSFKPEEEPKPQTFGGGGRDIPQPPKDGDGDAD